MRPAPTLFDLHGRSALVTGATGYLGSAMAWALAEAGATVLVNSRDAGRADGLVEAIRNAGLQARPAVFDVTDRGGLQAAVEACLGEDPLHILINNAYAGGAGTVETASPDAYAGSYDVTVASAHVLLQTALPALRRAVQHEGEASVINLASMYGMVSPDIGLYDNPSGANPPFYGAAKAALIQWSRYAACEFGNEGIRVNSVSPGPFPTPQVHQQNAEFVARLVRKVPMARVGQADEIRGPILFLASPASSFVNGANIVVDGGWTAW